MKSDNLTRGDMPSPDEIRAALERMVGSEVFAGSPQLVTFLRFVVEAELRGESDRIKGYTIGVEALGRSESFDPQVGPIVRVEATRLRRAIERYYAGPGADDPIVIELTRGSYVPTFRRRVEASPQPQMPWAAALARTRRRWAMAAALILGGVVLVVAWPIVHQRDRTPDVSQIAAAGGPSLQATDALQPGNGMPVLFVEPFVVVGTPGPHSIAAGAFHDMLSDAFAHFDLVNIVWKSSSQVARVAGSGTASEAQIDYRLVGAIEYADDGAARIRFRLIDPLDAGVVWSRVFEQVVASDLDKAAEETIVRELATTLVQPFGVIYAHGRGRLLATDPRYRCVLETAESFRSFDLDQYTRARECLERLTAIDPSFAVGFTHFGSHVPAGIPIRRRRARGRPAPAGTGAACRPPRGRVES